MEQGETGETKTSLLNENCCIKCRIPESPQYDNLCMVDKGIQRLIDYSLKNDDHELYKYLCSKKENGETVRIHVDCQKSTYNELKRKRDSVNAKKYTRTQSSKFNWKENCLFCGETCVEDKKHPDRKKMRMATTIPFKERLIFACQKRDDEWGEEVGRRVTNCNDLVAVEACYHISCNERFLGKHSTFKSPSGRPTDSVA